MNETTLSSPKKHIIALLCAIFGGTGLILPLPSDNQFNIQLTVLILIFALYFTWLYFLKHMTKRSLLCSAPAALLLAVFFKVGGIIDNADQLNFSPSAFLTFLLGTLGTGLAFLPILLIFAIPSFGLKTAMSPKGHFMCFLSGGKLFFFACWLFFFLSFVPALLAYWPGIFAYDLTTQITQFEAGMLNENHPLLHTLLSWVLLNIGRRGDNCNIGAFSYSIFQMLCLSGSFAYAMNYLTKKRTALGMRIAVLLYFLLPFQGLFAINATKDVLYAALFLLFFLFTVELALEPDHFFSHPLLWLRYGITILLSSLMRNSGICVVILFLILAVLFFRRYKLRMLALSLSCLAVWGAVSFGLNCAFSVTSGSPAEGMSLPIQQVSRAWRDNRDRFTEDEAKRLLALISEDKLELYQSRLSDPIKNAVVYSQDPKDRWDSKQIKEFLSLWLELLPRCPGAYLNASLCLNCGYWYPDMRYPDYRSYHEYIETSIKPMGPHYIIQRSVKSQHLNRFYASIASGVGFRNVPVLSLLFTPGIYIWLLIAAWVAAVSRRKYRILLPLGLLAVFWVTLLLCPIALLRYAYPMMICVPIAVILPLLPPPANANNSSPSCTQKSNTLSGATE